MGQRKYVQCTVFIYSSLTAIKIFWATWVQRILTSLEMYAQDNAHNEIPLYELSFLVIHFDIELRLSTHVHRAGLESDWVHKPLFGIRLNLFKPYNFAPALNMIDTIFSDAPQAKLIGPAYCKCMAFVSD